MGYKGKISHGGLKFKGSSGLLKVRLAKVAKFTVSSGL